MPTKKELQEKINKLEAENKRLKKTLDEVIYAINNISIEEKEEEDYCYACNNGGICYLSDGIYGPCINCDRGSGKSDDTFSYKQPLGVPGR